MTLGTSTIFLYLSGKEVAVTASDTITVDGNEIAGAGWDHASGTLLWDRDSSLSGSLNETGLANWNRDLELSNNVASVSGLIGGGYEVFDTWTGDETITDTYNKYFVNLNGGTVAQMALPDSITSGFSFTVWNRGTGTWTFSGVTKLINLDDSSIVEYAVAEKELVTFLNKGSNIWQVISEDNSNFVTTSQTGDFLDLTSQTALELRDTNLSANVATLSGDVTTQTNRITSLSGSMDTTGLDLWNRDLELSNNVASISGNILYTSASGDYLRHRLNHT